MQLEPKELIDIIKFERSCDRNGSIIDHHNSSQNYLPFRLVGRFWGKAIMWLPLTQLSAMQLLLWVIGFSTALGFGYFCLDFYRNRRRLLTKPTTDLVVYDVLPYDGADVGHVGHTVSGTECISGGLGHCVDAIAHSLSHL